MSPGAAAHQIACMEAIVADYEATNMASFAADFWEKEEQDIKREVAARKGTKHE